MERAYDGIERRVLCFDDEKIQVDYTIDADAVFPEHEEARQTVYVVSGTVGLTGTRRFNIAARELLDNNRQAERRGRQRRPTSRYHSQTMPSSTYGGGTATDGCIALNERALCQDDQWQR